MVYQSHDPSVPGDSDSFGKLAAIKLPDLTGKRFLDIGCNEGFFCGHAIRDGASRVVGIEILQALAEAARRRYPTAEILNQPWSALPSEQFDVIIMLSALQYEPRPKDLAKRICDHLAPDGLFILECGAIESPDNYWFQAYRDVGTVWYPTTRLLVEHVLEDFAVRIVGESVRQVGDLVPRYVFHCQKKVTTYIIAGGDSGIGKTNLTYALQKRGMTTVVTDMLIISSWLRKDRLEDTVLMQYLQQLKDAESLGAWVDQIKEDDLARRLASFLFAALPKEPDIVFVEGYVFNNVLVLQHMRDLFRAAGLRAWFSERIA